MKPLSSSNPSRQNTSEEGSFLAQFWAFDIWKESDASQLRQREIQAWLRRLRRSSHILAVFWVEDGWTVRLRNDTDSRGKYNFYVQRHISKRKWWSLHALTILISVAHCPEKPVGILWFDAAPTSHCWTRALFKIECRDSRTDIRDSLWHQDQPSGRKRESIRSPRRFPFHLFNICASRERDRDSEVFRRIVYADFLKVSQTIRKWWPARSVRIIYSN